MIRVDRTAVDPPASLSRKATRGRLRGKTEEEAIIAEYAAYLATQPPPGKPFDFPFVAYKSDDVKRALERLFHGKCAYCEQRYAALQPMDVEHWRPKGGVLEPGAKTLSAGYPWLAASWTNLLPSCIDCNRPRTQRDALTGRDETLGKANQFPVTGQRLHPPAPGDPSSGSVSSELPLLIDPTVDDPTEHLHFREDGVVTSLTDKGAESVRVYALNRAELAFERMGLAQLIEQRLSTIEALAMVIALPRIRKQARLDLEDLISHEIDALLALAEPDRPFSALARQLIEENAPELARTDPDPDP